MRKKVAYESWLANKSSVELRLHHSESRKTAATKVKLSIEKACKKFGKRFENDDKYSDRPFVIYVEKDLKPFSSFKIQTVSP